MGYALLSGRAATANPGAIFFASLTCTANYLHPFLPVPRTLRRRKSLAEKKSGLPYPFIKAYHRFSISDISAAASW